MKPVVFMAPLLAAMMLVGPLATPSTAQTTPPLKWSSSQWQWSSPSAVTTDPWKFSASLYGWMPTATATVDTQGQSVHLPEPFMVILKARFFAGYRHVHIDYDDGNVGINVNVTGPLLGLGVDY